MLSNHHTILVTFKLNKTKFIVIMYNIITMRKIPYANVIVSLMHVLVCTWPNITYLVFHIWQFINNPRNKNWATTKWILRYIKTIIAFGIMYSTHPNQIFELVSMIQISIIENTLLEENLLILKSRRTYSMVIKESHLPLFFIILKQNIWL
jgi:hypothetical protein